MKNIIYIDNYNGEFYCPVTGKHMLDPEMFYGASEATVFIYISICNEFECSIEGFEETFEEIRNSIEEEEGDYDIMDVVDKTRSKLKMNQLVVFCLNDYGIDSCGPHSNFDLIGIDFSKGKINMDDE